MKKLLISGAFIGLILSPALAQETANQIEQPESFQIKCKRFTKTAPLRDMIPYLAVGDDAAKDFVVKDHDRDGFADPSTIEDKTDADPIAQTEMGWRDGSGMIRANFDGHGGTTQPPDPTGAAGLEHYVFASNGGSFRVYNKDGSTATPAIALSQIWGQGGDGDPIVMYDRYADRWFISEFLVDQAGSNDGLFMAVSETSDPTGSWYAYEFDTPISGTGFVDYPKYGVWSNGYYLSGNSSQYNCLVFEREKMLVGDANATMIVNTFPSSIKYFFRSFAPSYAEGLWAPGADDPFYYFHIQDDAWSGVSTDHIKVIEATVDWGAGTSNVQVVQEIPVASINTMFTFSWEDVAQQGTNQKIDAVAGIMMYRVQYIKRPGYNVALMCTTVDLNGNNSQAAIRWFELRQDAADPSGDWYLYQEGTYAPDSKSRWMGSMAMDINGHIGMAYCYSSTSDYPGIRYTGRYDGDPLGEMTVDEQIAIEGGGYQSTGFSSEQRYGDYSQMTLDPADDATFWFTGEYMAGNEAQRCRIFSFAMWELLGTEKPEMPASFNAYKPEPNTLKVVWNSIVDEEFDIQLIDMNGKIIKTERANNSTSEVNFDLPSFAKGIYLIKLSGKNTDLTEKVYL